MSAFTFPTPNTSLKSTAVSIWGTGLIVPALHDNDAWIYSFATVGLTQTSVSGLNGTAVSGYTSACAGGSGDAWLLQESGALVDFTSGGVGTAYTLASGLSYVGVAFHSTQNAPYVINSAGTLYTPSGSGMATVTPNFNGNTTKFLAVSGTTLFTLLPIVSELGWITMTGLLAGSSGTISTPMTTPSCLAASTSVSAVAVGGYSVATLGSGFSDIAAAPNGLTFAGANSGTGDVLTWSQANSLWAFNNVVSGMPGVASLAWAPGGTNIIATSTVSGKVYSLTYSLGILTLSQTLTLSNAGAPGITTDGLHALVCQPTLGTVTPYALSGSTWAVSGSAFNCGTPQCIAMVSVSGAVIGCSSGLAVAAYTSGTNVWSITSTGSVGFTPGSIAVDSSGNIYSAGTSGANGMFSINTSGLTLIASGSYAGSVSGLAYTQGQLILGDAVNDIIRIFGSTTWTQQGSALAPTGLDTLAFGGSGLFAAGTTQTWQYNITSPYTLAQAASGSVSIYKSGAWSTLAVGGLPEAITWDPSGNVSMTNNLNTLYSISSGATLIGTSGIPQDSNQPSTTPIGLSSLVWANNHLYGSTCLADALVFIK